MTYEESIDLFKGRIAEAETRRDAWQGVRRNTSRPTSWSRLWSFNLMSDCDDMPQASRRADGRTRLTMLTVAFARAPRDGLPDWRVACLPHLAARRRSFASAQQTR